MKFKEIVENIKINSRNELKVLDKIYDKIIKLKLPFYFEQTDVIKIFDMPGEGQPGYDEDDYGDGHDYITISVDKEMINIESNDGDEGNFELDEINKAVKFIKKLTKDW